MKFHYNKGGDQVGGTQQGGDQAGGTQGGVTHASGTQVAKGGENIAVLTPMILETARKPS